MTWSSWKDLLITIWKKNISSCFASTILTVQIKMPWNKTDELLVKVHWLLCKGKIKLLLFRVEKHLNLFIYLFFIWNVYSDMFWWLNFLKVCVWSVSYLPIYLVDLLFIVILNVIHKEQRGLGSKTVKKITLSASVPFGLWTWSMLIWTWTYVEGYGIEWNCCLWFFLGRIRTESRLGFLNKGNNISSYKLA